MNIARHRALWQKARPVPGLCFVSTAPRESRYDAVVVGGGHNGLVAAAYLAKCGKSVCVLERRHVVGGAAVSEEIVPGYTFSRASYLLSLLRPQIYKELELKKHGLEVYLREPSSYTPLKKEFQKPGGPTSLTLGSNAALNKAQIGQFSQKDAEAYERYEEELNKYVDVIEPLLDHPPQDLVQFKQTSNLLKFAFLDKVMPMARAGRAALEASPSQLLQLVTAPTTKILDQWFESEPLKATLATDACIGAMISPESPGSGYVLLHHVMGELEGHRGRWGYPRGGMGGVSAALAKSAEASGAEIYTEASVKEICVRDKEARGVVLSEGDRFIEASMVLSNATPKVTFLDLIQPANLTPEFRTKVAAIDYTSPVTKINVALNRLPNFAADPNRNPNEALPHHQCTIHLNCEESSMLHEAYEDARSSGDYSRRPMIEMTIPSVLDDSLAPEGHHVCLMFTQYTPYELSNGRKWDVATRKEYADLIFNTVEEYAPGFRDSIVGHEVLTPPDLEATFGLTGGNIFHGAMSLDQLYLSRPVAAKDRFSPETPVENLLLCGSGAHPGGGVMGAAGRMAAKYALDALGGAQWQFQ